MNLIVSGGVDKDKDTWLVPYYAGLLKKGKILYLPLAKITRPFVESYEKMKFNMRKLGFTGEIAFWDSLKGKNFTDLDAFDSLYIEGGNPFILLDEIKKNDFAKALKSYIESGKLVYGQSAGALIMGADIAFAASAYDVENTPKLQDTSGLNLFKGYSFFAHYTDEKERFVKDLIKEKGFKFIGLSNYTGIHFSKNNKVCGLGQVSIFNGISKRVFTLGENFKLEVLD